MTKPRMIRKCGVWTVNGPPAPDAAYWPLFDAAIAWCVRRWKDENP